MLAHAKIEIDWRRKNSFVNKLPCRLIHKLKGSWRWMILNTFGYAFKGSSGMKKHEEYNSMMPEMNG